MMLVLLLTTTLVFQPVMGCIAGVKFVPPASLVIEPIRRASKASQSECVPCSRGGLRGGLSPRFAWPEATTSLPCCPETTTSTISTTTSTTSTTSTSTTTNYFTNATGKHNYMK